MMLTSAQLTHISAESTAFLTLKETHELLFILSYAYNSKLPMLRHMECLNLFFQACMLNAYIITINYVVAGAVNQ